MKRKFWKSAAKLRQDRRRLAAIVRNVLRNISKDRRGQ